jgi:endonuclease/exonuclease/phosphatase family metal-dependent hydrolase
MKFKFGSWNVNNRRPQPGHLMFLEAQQFDMVALQEASPTFHLKLLESGLFSWGVSSLTIRPPATAEGRARRFGVSIVGREPLQLRSSQLLDGLQFPERALVAQTFSPAGPLTVCSFHIPPGASWGNVKTQTQKAIAVWLSGKRGPVIVGIDANSPKTDTPIHDEVEFWPMDEPLLLGPKPLHRLRDAFRLFLADRPAILDEIQHARPTGPLAVSHRRGSGTERTPCRYDFILVSPQVKVDHVEYVFDESLSDHALVAGQFEVTSSGDASRSENHAGNGQ